MSINEPQIQKPRMLGAQQVENDIIGSLKNLLMNNPEASHRGINTQEGTQKLFSLLSPTPQLHQGFGVLAESATSLKAHYPEVAT